MSFGDDSALNNADPDCELVAAPAFGAKGGFEETDARGGLEPAAAAHAVEGAAAGAAASEVG